MKQLVYDQCRIETSRVSAAEPTAEITRECQLRAVTLGHAPMSAQCPVLDRFSDSGRTSPEVGVVPNSGLVHRSALAVDLGLPLHPQG
jgi:hypothetical protein